MKPFQKRIDEPVLCRSALRILFLVAIYSLVATSAFTQNLNLIGRWNCYWHIIIDDQDFDHQYFIEKSFWHEGEPSEYVFVENGLVTTTSGDEELTGPVEHRR